MLNMSMQAVTQKGQTTSWAESGGERVVRKGEWDVLAHSPLESEELRSAFGYFDGLGIGPAS